MDRKKGLDMLSFWKEEQYRYPILSHLAHDALSIPISIVASEYAFNIGCRVLDQNHNSLLPEIVQAVICTRDWIYGKKSMFCFNFRYYFYYFSLRIWTIIDVFFFYNVLVVDDCGIDFAEATEDLFNDDTS